MNVGWSLDNQDFGQVEIKNGVARIGASVPDGSGDTVLNNGLTARVDVLGVAGGPSTLDVDFRADNAGLITVVGAGAKLAVGARLPEKFNYVLDDYDDPRENSFPN